MVAQETWYEVQTYVCPEGEGGAWFPLWTRYDVIGDARARRRELNGYCVSRIVEIVAQVRVVE